jgi:hypothetical protein
MATIRAATDKIQATVAGFGKLKESQFNDSVYQSVLFEGGGLPEGKVWRSMTPDQAQGFTRGQAVYLVPTTNKKGQPSYDIELIAPAPTAPAATTQAPTQGKPATQGTSLDALWRAASFLDLLTQAEHSHTALTPARVTELLARLGWE